MFRDDRVYRAIVFQSNALKDLGVARSFFPKKSLTSAETTITCPWGKIDHMFYYSKNMFTRNVDILKEVREKKHGVVRYRYNMYFILISGEHSTAVMLAVPFLKMALEIYPILRGAIRGQDFEFLRIRLQAAVEASKRAEGLGAALKIVRAKYKIEGEGKQSDSLELIGTDLARSTVLNVLQKDFSESTLTAQSVRIALESSITFDTDSFGHYKFRVAKGGSNLQHMPEIFRALQTLKLVAKDYAFPYLKQLSQSDDELESSE
jgi:hypothetical protein